MRHAIVPERSPASAIGLCSAFGRDPEEGRTGWQDKSREVRGGGSDADALILQGLARGANFARTVCPLVTILNCSLFRTLQGAPHAR